MKNISYVVFLLSFCAISCNNTGYKNYLRGFKNRAPLFIRYIYEYQINSVR